MRLPLSALLVALPIALPAALPATAAEGVAFRAVVVSGCSGPATVCLDVPLLGDAPTRALDLLRLIYPDLAADGSGERFAGAEAVEAASDPDGGAAAERPVDLGVEAADVAVVEDGDTAYAAAVSAGVVALAAVRPTFRPLGRLYVATDPGGPTAGYRLLLAGRHRPLVVTASSHFNSEESYQSLHVVGAVGGALVDLLDGPYLYSVAETTDDCERLDHAETVGRLETVPPVRHGVADLAVTVDRTVRCADDLRLLTAHSFAMRFGYDGGRYRGSTAALDAVNAAGE